MQIPPSTHSRFRWLKFAFTAAAVLLVVGFAWTRAKHFAGATYVNLDELVVAEVSRGKLVREVRAPGTLVPVALHYVAATSTGRVEAINLEAGDSVTPDTVIMSLDNPELEQAVDAARYELDVLAAEFNALQQRLRHEVLNQRARVADFSARYQMAQLRSEANTTLLEKGAVSSIDHREAILLEQQLREQHAIEVERLQSLPTLNEAELLAAKARVNKAKRLLALEQELFDELQVRAGTAGVLQEVPLEIGEQFVTGTVLARVAGQEQLKAELRVQESQVKNVAKGQRVMISAGGYTANGSVKRIDPAVQAGIVIVDVYFEDDMLPGARPDLRVDGIIELETLEDVLVVKRPVFSQENTQTQLFVIDQGKQVANKRPVLMGKSAVDSIEIKSNLQAGERIIVSDTSRYNQLEQLFLRQ